MKKPKYLSPSSLAAWEKNPLQYYLQKISDYGTPAFPQTQPMSIGSAFDARWKNYVASKVLPIEFTLPEHEDDGIPMPAGAYHLDTLFKDQVDSEHQNWAWNHSDYVFGEYLKNGAMDAFLMEIQGGHSFNMEFTLEHTADLCGEKVPILGKPDFYCVLESGVPVIYDMKVNGYCSKTGVKPVKGWSHTYHTRKGIQVSPDIEHKSGVAVNPTTFMDTIKEEWATQLTMYAWMTGVPVGSEFICGIEQIACLPPSSFSPGVDITCVSIRNHVSTVFQETLANRLAYAWLHISNGYYFPSMSKAENDKYVEELENKLADPNERFFLLSSAR